MSYLNGSAGWPASALAAAEKAFNLLTTPPAPLVFDTRTIGHGLPAGMVPLDELRTVLLDPGTCDAARDACWHLLVDHARRWGPAWVVAAVGMALPALVRMAGKLCAGHSDRADDIEAELLIPSGRYRAEVARAQRGARMVHDVARTSIHRRGPGPTGRQAARLRLPPATGPRRGAPSPNCRGVQHVAGLAED